MDRLLEESLRQKIADKLVQLESLFVPEMILTFLARHPGNAEACVLVTVDDPAEIIKTIQYLKDRKD